MTVNFGKLLANSTNVSNFWPTAERAKAGAVKQVCIEGRSSGLREPASGRMIRMDWAQIAASQAAGRRRSGIGFKIGFTALWRQISL